MRILESKIENTVVDWWKQQGGLYLKLNVLGRRGWPDRLFLPQGGKPIFIEFKRVNEKSRKLQEYVHNELRSRGYRVYVCNNVPMAKAILACP